MSAREEAESLYLTAGMSATRAKRAAAVLLSQHAHELAEKQRAALAASPGLLEHELIDLIDPDKEGQ